VTNTVIDRLVNSHPEMLLDFINSPITDNLKDSDNYLKTFIEKEQFSAAFSLIKDKETAIEILEKDPSILDVDYKHMKLSGNSLFDFITHLLDQDDKKLHQFCTVLGRFVEESSFVALKSALKEKLSESDLIDFLTFWSSKIQSDDLALELLSIKLKLKQYEQVDKLCAEIEFSDPVAIFDFLQVRTKNSGLIKFLCFRNKIANATG
jgi:hypothetical protein